MPGFIDTPADGLCLITSVLWSMTPQARTAVYLHLQTHSRIHPISRLARFLDDPNTTRPQGRELKALQDDIIKVVADRLAAYQNNPAGLPPEIARAYRGQQQATVYNRLHAMDNETLVTGLTTLWAQGDGQHLPLNILADHYTSLRQRLNPGQTRDQATTAVRWRLDPQDEPAARAYLTGHGITPPTDPTDHVALRQAYLHALTNIGGMELGQAYQHIGWHLDTNSVQPDTMITELANHADHDTLVSLLAELHYHAPLTHQEHTALHTATLTWEDSWNTDYGESLVPLLAHTLDIQLRTTNTRDTRDTTTLNPTATNPITIYRSHNHYTAH
ncbi:hypothetical protein, partial [Lentzea tibetensis]|uniref:hypothetical protein n=1 Tax=Lentzea tibetensis TaxID=2591470 RepID=UPI001647FF4B